VVLTVAVLLVDAAVSSRSNGPAREQATLAYLDAIRPLIERSNSEAADIADVRTNAVQLGRDGIGRRLDRVSREADDVVRDSRRVSPPPALRDANDLLVATFAIRSKAAGTVRQAFNDALGTQPPEPAITSLVEVGKDMGASDRAYQLFLGSLPPASAPPAPSQWMSNDQDWTQPFLTTFVTALRSSQTLSPVHDLGVVLVVVDPAAVGSEGGITVLPSAKNLKLQIVVANAGNVAEKHATVTATVSPSAVGPSDVARDFVDLTPGQRRTVTLGTLRPLTGTSFTLLVRIEPVPGETSTADNDKTQVYVMR
jgi:hypothetical protein